MRGSVAQACGSDARMGVRMHASDRGSIARMRGRDRAECECEARDDADTSAGACGRCVWVIARDAGSSAQACALRCGTPNWLRKARKSPSEGKQWAEEKISKNSPAQVFFSLNLIFENS